MHGETDAVCGAERARQAAQARGGDFRELAPPQAGLERQDPLLRNPASQNERASVTLNGKLVASGPVEALHCAYPLRLRDRLALVRARLRRSAALAPSSKRLDHGAQTGPWDEPHALATPKRSFRMLFNLRGATSSGLHAEPRGQSA